MQIRPELSTDEKAISTVISAAFLKAEHSAGNETQIVDALRKAGSLTVSLVATENGEVVGHVAFSPVTIDGLSVGWYGLGPVAVVPGCQRMGTGSALIEAGLNELRARGADGCVVLGDPAYYSRFGFEADPKIRLAGVPPNYFQRLILGGPRRTGLVEYHPAFEVP